MRDERRGDSEPTIILIAAVLLSIGVAIGWYATRPRSHVLSLRERAYIKGLEVWQTGVMPYTSPQPTFRAMERSQQRRPDGSTLLELELKCADPATVQTVTINLAVEGAPEVGARIVSELPFVPLPVAFLVDVEVDPIPATIADPKVAVEIHSSGMGYATERSVLALHATALTATGESFFFGSNLPRVLALRAAALTAPAK